MIYNPRVNQTIISLSLQSEMGISHSSMVESMRKSRSTAKVHYHECFKNNF